MNITYSSFCILQGKTHLLSYHFVRKSHSGTVGIQICEMTDFIVDPCAPDQLTGELLMVSWDCVLLLNLQWDPNAELSCSYC